MTTPRSTRRRKPRVLMAVGAAALAATAIAALILPRLAANLLVSDAARPAAEAALTRTLGMPARFSPFTKTPDGLHADRLAASGDGLSLTAHDIRADAHANGLPGGTLDIRSLTARQVDIHINPDTSRPPPPPASAPPPEPPAWLAAFLPSRVTVPALKVGRIDLTAPSLTAHADQATLDHNDATLRLTAPTGGLTSPAHGSWSLRDLDILLDQNEIRIVRLDAHDPDSQANASATGTVDRASGQGELTARFEQIPLTKAAPILANRLDGRLAGRATVTPPTLPGQSPTVQADLSLDDAALRGLDLLTLLAAYTGSDQLRRIPIHTATAQMDRSPDGVTRIHDIHLESRGLLRVHGHLTITPDNALDGTLDLGLPTHLARSLPVDHNSVFLSEHDGFLWTPVRLSGTTSQPAEDLTARLTAAMPAGVARRAGQTIRAAGEILGLDTSPAADRAAESLNQAGSLLLDLLNTNDGQE